MINPKVMENQKEYCRINKAPEFAPTRTGRCYRCKRDITGAITEEEALTTLITGCPLCSWSYCD